MFADCAKGGKEQIGVVIETLSGGARWSARLEIGNTTS